MVGLFAVGFLVLGGFALAGCFAGVVSVLVPAESLGLASVDNDVVYAGLADCVHGGIFGNKEEVCLTYKSRFWELEHSI